MAERIEVLVDGSARGFARAANAAERDARSLGRTVRRENAQTAASTTTLTRRTDGLNTAVGRTNQNFSFLRNSMRLIKWPALIAGAGAATQGIAALSAGVVGLTSALGPLTGALVAYPALLGTLGQVAGTVALAGINDLTEALGGNEEALKRLTPAGREFLGTLQELRPEFERLQATAQQPIFAGLERGINDAMDNLPALRAVIGETADEMGRLSEQAGRFLGREGFGRDFEAIGSTNVQLFGDLGDATFHLADALRHVMVAADPFLGWLGRSVVAFSAFVEAEAEAARESGRLAAFFEDTRGTMERVVSIGQSLAATFLAIGRAARPLGDDILQAFDRGAESLERWAESTSGQNSLRKFFADARPAIFEAGRLIGDMTKGFFELASTPGLAPLIRQVRTELLPALLDMTRVATQNFGPVFVDFLVQAGKLFGTLVENGGALTVFVELLGSAAELLNELIDAAPVLGSALGGAFAGSAILSIFGRFSGGKAAAQATTAGRGFGRRFGAAAGPIAAALIAAEIAGLDALTKSAANPESVTGALDEGILRDYLRHLEDVGEGIDKNMVRQWVRAGKITAEQGGQIIAELRRINQEVAKSKRSLAEGQGFGFARAMAEDGELLRPEIKRILDQLDALPKGSRDTARRSMVDMARVMERMGALPEGATRDLVKALKDRFGEIPRDADRSGKDAFSNWDRWLKRTADAGDKHSKDLRDNVASNVQSLAKAVDDGLDHIVGNTNKALLAFGVKKIAFSIAKGIKSGGKDGGQKRQAGGMIVPGTGDGDKVPAVLPVGTGIINKRATRALLEPGELMVPPERVAAMGGPRAIHAINARMPRFATGGVAGGLDFALGPYTIPPIQYDPNHAGGNSHVHITMTTTPAVVAIGKKLQQMGWMVGEHPAFGGVNAQHSATGGHYDALAIDANTAADETRAEVAAVARLLSGAGGALGGSAVEKIERLLMGGPDGPLKDLGQAALDKAQKAANEFIAEKAPMEGAEPGAAISADGDVERIFAQVAKRLSDSKVATLALGMAGYAESGMRDLSYGHSSSQGALQLLASTAAGLGVSPHDEGAIASLFFNRGFYGRGGANALAAQGLPAHLVAQGVQGSATSDGSNYAAQEGPARAWMARFGLQRGGMVQRMAEGGVAGLQNKIGGLFGELAGAKGDERADIERQIAELKKKLDKAHGKAERQKLKKISQGGILADRKAEVAQRQGAVDILNDQISSLDTVHGLTEIRDVSQLLSDMGLDPDTELSALGPEHRAQITNLANSDLAREQAELGLETGVQNQALSALLALRESLLSAIAAAQRQAEEARKAAEEADRKQKAAEKDARQTEHKINDLRRDLDKLRDEKPPNRGPNEKKDDYDRRREAWEKSRRGKGRDLRDRISKQQFKKGEFLQRAGLMEAIEAAEIERRGQLLDAVDSEFMPALETVQGVGRTMQPGLGVAPLGVGVPRFGGEILAAQAALARLGSTDLVRASLDFTGPEEDDSADAELFRQRFLEEQLRANLGAAQFGAIRGFLKTLDLPFLGTFAHGLDIARSDGIARIHKGESIGPAPEGPFVNTAAAAQAGRPVEVNLYAEGDLAPLMRKLRAETAGQQLDVIDRSLGRRRRQRAVAPGGR